LEEEDEFEDEEEDDEEDEEWEPPRSYSAYMRNP